MTKDELDQAVKDAVVAALRAIDGSRMTNFEAINVMTCAAIGLLNAAITSLGADRDAIAKAVLKRIGGES